MATGVTAGTSAGHFSPNSPCTRAQIVTFLYRAAGSPAVSPGGSFTDVPAGAYYELPVSWAVANGITTGTSSTRFSPDSPCTRAQIVTFLYRARSIKLDPQPVKSWREVYREFIEEQQFLNAGQDYSFQAGWFLVSVYDMDRDGTPELLIQNGATGRVDRWGYLYTCVAGKVQYLGIGPAEPYYDPSNPVGIYARFPDPPNENWEIFTKSGLIIARSMAGTFPLWEGHKELTGLPASRDDAIRSAGWDAFLATQPIG
ncbi:MAG: S-layer homology domain-containing protein [Oscillospiraceae bacterium]|nr:S-layer homology domain-containing protein [Oscillospiraceae bacterium]